MNTENAHSTVWSLFVSWIAFSFHLVTHNISTVFSILCGIAAIVASINSAIASREKYRYFKAKEKEMSPDKDEYE